MVLLIFKNTGHRQYLHLIAQMVLQWCSYSFGQMLLCTRFFIIQKRSLWCPCNGFTVTHHNY